MLNTPNYDVRTSPYCGPTAISAVTGEPISRIRELAQNYRGPKSNGHARAIMGMSNKELLSVMAQLGWRVVQSSGDTDNRNCHPMDVFRLDDFLDAVQLGKHGGDSDGPYIVNVTGHYYAVGWGEICDNNFKLPMPIHKFKRGRRRWVKQWWKFERIGF
jgi:hypothetical protein